MVLSGEYQHVINIQINFCLVLVSLALSYKSTGAFHTECIIGVRNTTPLNCLLIDKMTAHPILAHVF